ncbi:MAG: preprotein translocase subunit SecA [Candidatus Yanofskybacteria bacterium RIFCSPHIGHO2_02_FULL_41_29]|uniref:Protein translocase subunit SecA n=1 Tax=Candidatus Yanofskybacteria bacterium RIFCSPHIGHO2_01_FULL_41_53 TaxID=1802663 RepID=A0A1F8EH69_9BACT|nr:MAG: preprotein translocase subunit SecA [Candidatus Yanofskybacteria bacterium RIFCSPHIGHO2_01_FULL_41_53]OGN11219.1 MAG: preprotein translocase subunit SecA [Candidatus Yanofskybacteria bacterium RIFCSPHIGHO2_02_FULL_41_29]OGN16966.1 MAG: preprotein translocase subunit SecA [Candidatus Yanofskybacteria bacterium RIFCSPHIGHO2_12_FULL_41_9]OGN22285.1 MAG: preprotein translocase subunit SecA [Candidatus Yanofskybacteria bacterium RIFCSPLOWO2_01_FULL_41_67]OGN29653.1 MAG: preprotein translocas
MSFLSKIFGDANERYIKSLQSAVDRINELEKEFGGLSDAELKDKTVKFKKRLSAGELLDDLLPEAFAAVREASKRTLGQRHFDVQLIGGVVLHQGKITEMRTGEGKTLVATLPAYLNALTGRGVHIVSVNDFLVRRDTAWMGQIYNALGLTVGCINHEGSYLYDEKHRHEGQRLKIKDQNDHLNLKDEREQEDKERDTLGAFKVVYEFLRPVGKREAYYADITYGTNNEYGFDYLRDNMAYQPESMSQRPNHNFVIVDEVDSILIDEARTPLIISAPDTDSTALYGTFSKIVPRLTENEDYNVDEKLKAISITESGIEKVEKMLGLSNIYDQGGVRHVHHLEQALKANILFKRDRDYVVKDGEVIIVDEFTGRLMPGRRWSDGLHQAVEAKENVSVQKESRTLATITFQNYFRLYKKISGMTGTAQTSAEEFHKVYKIDVVSIPTNKPTGREDLSDKIYKTEMGKFKAVAREIKEKNEKGQPVLVGTVSIEKNELLSKLLEREGVRHNVLNAKNHEREAEIVAQAGRLGAVTVATNMAGRGVDIILGGNPVNSEEAAKVCELGGLYVIGTERHEARRIDDQLRGRAGRQGDPGLSQFFVSTDDDVIRVFGGDRLKNLMNTLGIGEDDVIENRFVSSAIEQAQFRIEGHNFDIRKYVLEYDDVMNKHRDSIYRLRKEVLFSENIKETVLSYVLDTVRRVVNFNANEESDDWRVEEISESIQAITGKDNNLHTELIEISAGHDYHKLSEFVSQYVVKKYEAKESENGAQMRQLEKFVLLRTVDEIWMDHIEAMEQLRDSVRLRAYGQRDPLIEYKIEGQKMFEQLQDTIKGQVTNLIFKVSFMQQPRQVQMEEHKPEIAQSLKSKAKSQNNDQAFDVKPSALGSTNIGRNDPCPCGAINPVTNQVFKWKKCHGK